GVTSLNPTSSVSSGPFPGGACLVSRWLEHLICQLACNALISTLFRIRSPPASSEQYDLELSMNELELTNKAISEVGPSSCLTEHSIKQLEIDLNYFISVLEDLGLNPPAGLLAFRELLICPAEDFASISADKPLKIVHYVTSLRGT
ncbi:unnamed protein product, partial [Protopolystoma xenopodis]